jgi:aldehyde dehydrogenase (NAD+)
MTTREEAKRLVDRQREYFFSGATRELDARRRALEAVRNAVVAHESKIVEAVAADMRRAPLETFTFEIAMILGEVEFTLSQLESWAAPRSVPPVAEQPGALGRIHPEPYGVTLIQAAWNYPIMQLFTPLIGALAAGNTALLRPASTSPNCARVAAEITARAFEPELVTCLVGPSSLTNDVIAAPVDYAFFTGSPKVGRTIMELCAKHLVPVTLELGGKSPTIVDKSADVTLAARKIAWGKLCNAGQICLAVDHVYAHRDIIDELIAQLGKEFDAMVGGDPAKSPDLGRMINGDNFSRAQSYLEAGRIAYGGRSEALSRYIQPTILTDVNEADPVMQEEIFAPILPILPFAELDGWIAQQKRKPKPLGMYIFASDEAVIDKIIRETAAGGVCINDTMVHSVAPTLPFGGVGNSGMGAYHGKYSFDTFSHFKPVLDATKLAMDWRYMPYTGKLEALKQQIGWKS